MTTDNLGRKVKQLEHDVLDIYEMLSDISTTQGQHSVQLAGLRERLDGHDERFDGIDERFDGIDGRLDKVDGRLDKVDQSLEKILTLLRAG